MAKSKTMRFRTITQIAVDSAVEIFGTQVNLAQAAGVSRQAVQNWGEWVPLERMPKLMRYKVVREAAAKYS